LQRDFVSFRDDDKGDKEMNEAEFSPGGWERGREDEVNEDDAFQ
jgi:hypothetical protein